MASSVWKWPVVGPNQRISSEYGYRLPPTAGATSNHKGIDIAAPADTPIVAASSGKVISSGSASGYGNWIRIDHGNGIISIYGHMYKKGLLVSVGDTVEAGDVIGLVGSAGTSTGNHLHFQIEVNGEPQNPNEFVSAEGDSLVDPEEIEFNVYEDGGGYATPNAYYNYDIDQSGTTIGQRVSGLTTQPIHAFVNIYLGDNLELLTTAIDQTHTVQMFEYNRIQDAGETATFTVFDDDWEEIEYKLSENFDKIYIEYGYPGTGLKSKLIRHKLLNYSIAFEMTGAIISVQSVTEGAYDNLNPRSLKLDTYNPTEAVKSICRDLGYIVRDENFDSSQDISADNPFNLVEEFPITYIMNKIIPQAAQEGEEIFTFRVDPDRVAYFKREDFSTSRTDTMRTYIWQKGYDSPVIDLTFDLKGVFGGTGTFELITEYRNSMFDTKDKHEETHITNKKDTTLVATGDVSHTHSKQSTPIVDSAGYTHSQTKAILNYYMKAPQYDAYKANMTILGDPTLELYESIRIINVTDKGRLHHTSGVYRIDGITDTIQGGEMVTSLELTRNALYNIEGIEILNPKVIVK